MNHLNVQILNQQLSLNLDKVCQKHGFPEEKKLEFTTEITRRNASRSVSGMPLNLIFSLANKDIQSIEDYKKLD